MFFIKDTGTKEVKLIFDGETYAIDKFYSDPFMNCRNKFPLLNSSFQFSEVFLMFALFYRVFSAPPELIQVSSSGHARVGKPHQLHIALTATHPITGEYYNFHT